MFASAIRSLLVVDIDLQKSNGFITVMFRPIVRLRATACRDARHRLDDLPPERRWREWMGPVEGSHLRLAGTVPREILIASF